MPNQPDENAGQPGAPRPKSPRGRSLNVEDFFVSEAYRLSIESREHPDERAARIRREHDDADRQHRKEMAILWWVLATVSVVSVICLGVFLIPGAPAENVRWATTLLTTVVSGGLGYMTGKNSKSAS